MGKLKISAQNSNPLVDSRIQNTLRKRARIMKYAIILLSALVIAIGCLVLSTSIDHILLEKLFIACTIVFSTLALKVASVWKVPVK